MKIILLSAKARHGKDTFAKMLKEELEKQGKTVVIDRFAKYIKGYCKQLGWDGITKDEYWRDKLQQLGTEVIKQQLNYKCFHGLRLAEDIQIIGKVFNVDYFIISDTRFRDEIYAIKSMFPDSVITIRIERPNFDNNMGELNNHISECDLDNFDFDYFVVNYSLESLKDKAELFSTYFNE